jgi:hypothetical protein
LLDLKDLTVIDRIPVTSVARTLLDLSAVVRPPDLEVAIDRAERLGVFDLAAVVDVLDRANGKKGARALRRASPPMSQAPRRASSSGGSKRSCRPLRI